MLKEEDRRHNTYMFDLNILHNRVRRLRDIFRPQDDFQRLVEKIKENEINMQTYLTKLTEGSFIEPKEFITWAKVVMSKYDLKRRRCTYRRYFRKLNYYYHKVMLNRDMGVFPKKYLSNQLFLDMEYYENKLLVLSQLVVELNGMENYYANGAMQMMKSFIQALKEERGSLFDRRVFNLRRYDMKGKFTERGSPEHESD
ncbi:hypothetical protein EIN_161720 [Entamoeba invadens IP1]|uniref:Uncharacterized protein n=1 Tax=Entamoeba invadens IP1 TaxID=370355 RepID=A0A0A1TYK8_ENTIV|nr:hypothetical protein EIN_161720 [Entamoeba invadens IP1]ELP86558.1 hypothetical protein EIN_161720 [Entamoeba invadens IP1]|eukprot:XP_004185904.1 hypothetical protein EIN_161720 [Entamoeba invadens IP1]